MTKNDAVDFYHSLMRFGIKPGLERIAILLERLGNPHKELKYIHIAGTNGKGSTCTYIASVLKSAGYTVGLYTSPYVIEFSERIRLNGEMIKEKDLICYTEKVKAEIEKLQSENIVITEFEAVTAAAFLYYKEKKCDFVVLETGLGGRFDATNVIEKNLVSCIVSISLDHTAVLGNTTEQIAFEKCGIIKKNCPVITFKGQDNSALEVIKAQAKKKNSELYIADTQNYSLVGTDIFGSKISVADMEVTVPFSGVHQIENAITALKVIDVLKMQGVNISEKAIKEGIANSKIPARCEILSKKPLIILDGCHNDGSTSALKNVIENSLRGRKIYAVMGMMADKECEKSAKNLVPLFHSVTVTKPSNPRSMSCEAFCKIAEKYCNNVDTQENPVEAVKKNIEKLTDENVLIICGSLYLASDVYGFLSELNF